MTKAEQRMLALAAAAVLFACVLALAYVGAFHKPHPHGVSVAIVAPPAAATEFEHEFAARAPGAITFHPYSSSAAAVTAVTHRDTDGGAIVTGNSLELLVAGAGGSLTKQFLTETFGSAANTAHLSFTVRDVVPLPGHDSGGISIFFLLFAALLPSLVLGVGGAIAGSGARPLAHAGVLAAGSIAIGFCAELIAGPILGATHGHFLALVALIALDAFAVSAFAAGVTRFAAPLAAIPLLLFLVIGMPASGGPAGMAKFVPGFFRFFTGWLPLPRALEATTNTVYFGGHHVTGAVVVLLAWSLVGLILIYVHGSRKTPL